MDERTIKMLDWKLLTSALVLTLIPLLGLALAFALAEDLIMPAKRVVAISRMAMPIFMAGLPITGFRMIVYRPGVNDTWADGHEVPYGDLAGRSARGRKDSRTQTEACRIPAGAW